MALLIKNFRSINNLEKNDMISGANICIEIQIRSIRETEIGFDNYIGLLICILYGFIPLIYKYVKEEEWSEEKTRTYKIMFFAVVVIRWLNWVLVYANVVFFRQKLLAKKYVLSMLDKNFARQSGILQHMPIIIDLNP